MPLRTLLLLLALPVQAQLVVRVETGGVGVRDAEVAVWSDSGRVAGGRSDAFGRARLAIGPDAREGTILTVRRMGFVPVRRPLPEGDTIVVALVASASPLPVLAVRTRVLRCPVRDDPAARGLWEAAARRYAPGQELLYFGYVDLFADERVPAESRGYGDAMTREQMGATNALNHTEGSLALRRVPPYASFSRHHGIAGEFTQWRYAMLDDWQALHFASVTFGERHAFTLLGTDDGDAILGFCPLTNERPAIEGEIRIGADTSLRAARWQFLVPRDDEDAGGEVTFGVGRLEGAEYLVAVRGSWWRRADRGHYGQRRFERLGWRFGRTGEAAQTGWVGRGDLGGSLSRE